MAKTSYINLPIGTDELFLKGLKSGDRFQFARMIRNDTLLTKRSLRGLTQKSLLPQIAVLWAAFSDAQRTAWATAGAVSGMKGWNLFVQDQCIRFRNSMSGSATPVITHQSWVGEIVIASPATEIKLIQTHPSSYFISKKVYGKKGMYIPFQLTEGFGLPLQIGISYKSNLTSAGASPSAKFYAQIKNSYQGVDDEYLLSIELPLSHDWETLTATLSSLRGTIIGYNLFIDLHDVTGSLFFDNIQAVHNGQNWVRDAKCTAIAQTFSKQYFQVPKHWLALTLPTGAEYDSVYQDF